MERTPLQAAVEGWLADRPLPVAELGERAAQAGLVPAEVDDDGFGPADHIQDLLERSDAFWSTNTDDGDVVVLTRTFVETGMTFTHRVTEQEVAAEAVDLAPDLSVVDWDCPDGLPLDDGSGRVVADLSAPSSSTLAGPLDWIEAVRAGDVLAFARSGGVLSVEVVDEVDLGDGRAEVEALRDAAACWIGDGRGEEEMPVVMEAMARDPQLFRRPVPPVGELLEAAGLERRGPEWGWAGERWQTRQERFQGHDRAIRRLYGFNRCCDHAFDRVEDAWLAHIRGAPIDGRSLADDLGHGSVAAAFVYAHAATPEAVTRFARAAADAATDRHTGPALTLLGMAHLRGGEPEAAVEALEAAVRADPDSPAAAGALAVLELDRGNLSRAHTLAVRDDADPDLPRWIEDERARQAGMRPSAGRNDPCPCGSGRKFKKCCAAGTPLTLAQRVPLVLRRMGYYATGPEGHDTLFGLALSAATGHDDVVEAVRRLRDDAFLVDVAVHEGGLGEDYLDQRGPLLAEDEVALLEMMFEEPRRLWEITAVTPGESLTLRDTASGDELVVVEHKGSADREPGELLLARATTVDGSPMLFGVPLVIPLRERARVLGMLDSWVDADALATWYGSLSLPLRMTNREGEDVVLRRTVVEIAGATDATIAALDETYERQGDDDLIWHEMTVVDGHDRVIRGVLRLDGPRLTVESNSEERQDRVLGSLDKLFDFTIVDDEHVDDVTLDGEKEHGVLDPAHVPDEVRAAVQQHITEYEERWVDESIPALGGLTPRQALDDPTRREDLFALLREMRTHDVPDDAVGMSVDHIERLLEIDPR